MLIDFNTGKQIKTGALTVSQTLTKVGITTNQDSGEIPFEEVVTNNGIHPPDILIKQFAAVLNIMKEGKSLSPEHIDFLLEQCEDWEVSDQFAIVE